MNWQVQAFIGVVKDNVDVVRDDNKLFLKTSGCSSCLRRILKTFQVTMNFTLPYLYTCDKGL